MGLCAKMPRKPFNRFQLRNERTWNNTMLVGEICSASENRRSDMTDISFPTLERLSLLYKKHGASNPVLLKLNCSQCGNNFEAELHSTSRGFGINGGILLVTKDDQLTGKCLDCYKQTDRCTSD